VGWPRRAESDPHRRGRSQCVLRLAPYVLCDTPASRAITALAAITFVVFTAGFPLVCSLALWHGEGRPWLAAPVRYLRGPVRAAAWRWIWAGGVRFGKKLLFAVLVNASSFDPVSLPLSAFLALVCVLLLQGLPPTPCFANRTHTHTLARTQ
jgi:hypothetical protein